ncbi:MAG TPA: PAS domain S-box protein, partial [Pyrinomonadaceae bacterium]|nr:PAS domain S-box protein [Pyrinomonadaceae bacterium]
DEVMGRRIADLVTPDLLKEQAEKIMDRVRDDQSWQGEFLMKRRDGSTFTAHVVDSPIHDASGELVGIIGVTIDLRERKAIEDALRKSEERLRLLMESFVDFAIFTTDINGTVEDWNAGAETIFGYKANEIAGQSADLVFTPEDRAARRSDEERKQARETSRASDERWHVRKDGSRFYASGVMAPLYDGASLIGYAKIARDLTDQKNVEKQLERNREELEKRVVERTRDLGESNKSLRKEIVDRKRIEEERVGLLQRIVTAQEDERKRIAREIHDHLGQRVTGLRLKIAAVKNLCDTAPLRNGIERIEAIGALLDSEISYLAWELRPAALDDLGLEMAIDNYVREWTRHFDTAAEFHSSGLENRRLAPEIEINFYRITQEALNNVIKHAGASQTSVLLELRKGKIVLIIEDNGKGFDPSGEIKAKRSVGGLGLLGMRERAAIVGGELEIESELGKGTTIYATAPSKFVG